MTVIETRNCERGLGLPVSPVQQGMLFHYAHEKGKNYVEQLICDIVGELDISLLTQTLNAIIETHDALRMLFICETEGDWRQMIVDHEITRIMIDDISSEEDPTAFVDHYASRESSVGFTLCSHAYRCKLFRVGVRHHVFLWTYHHAIVDSWTLRLLLEEFCRVYLDKADGTRRQDSKQYSYRLYLQWIAEQNQVAARDYWRNYLMRHSERSLCPPAPICVVNRENVDVRLGPGTRALLGHLASKHRVTINSAVLAVWGMYALDYCQRDEVIVGCVTSGRMIPLKDIDKIAGMFVNCVPVCVNSASIAAHFIPAVQAHLFDSAKFSYLSLSDIMGAARLHVGDISMVLNFSIDAEELQNNYSALLPFKVTNIRYNEQANYEVYLDVYVREDNVRIRIYYDDDKHYFNAHQVSSRLEQITQCLIASPMLSVKEIMANLTVDAKLSHDASFDFK